MTKEIQLQAQVTYLTQELKASHVQNHTLRQLLQKLLQQRPMDTELRTLVHVLLTDIQTLSNHHHQTRFLVRSIQEALSL